MSEKHDEVAEALGPDTLSECTRALLECATMGDLFDCAAGDLVEQRGYTIPCTGDAAPSDDEKAAYDAAFFDVLDVVLANVRTTWGGYYHTLKWDPPKHKLHIYCDVIHPESGEVLAEPGDVFVLPNPVVAHILAVAEAHPNHYYTYNDEDGQTGVWHAEPAQWQPTDHNQLLRACRELTKALDTIRDEARR